MRSKVLSYLLSFSLIFCVGFGSSLTASAAEFEQPTFAVEIHNYENNPAPIQYGSGAVLLKTNTSSKPVLEFDCIIPYGLIQSSSDFLVFNFVCHSSLQDVTPVPTMYLESYLINRYGTESAVIYNTSSTLFEGSYGFSFTTLASQFDGFNKTQLARVRVKLTWPEGNSRFETCLFTMSAMISSSDGSYNEIVAAIQDQTSDIQQSIEDQYSGDPGSSFPVDDIITQHNEKMGVLSFGSDTLMQVLGLLSPDQSLSSELVFPSMSLTIAGQRNKIQLWPEYRFDLNELKQHWPDFIGLMQSLTTALVWIFVLRYCYRVFEKYFLAGGGN